MTMLDPWNHPAVWHAVNVHFPIVLSILGLPLVCILAITRGRSRPMRWWTVGFYALVTVSAYFTMKTGLRAMGELPNTLSQAAWDRVNLHEWLATKVWIFSLITTAFLLLANLPRRWARQLFTTFALILSVVTVGWVAVTAHTGGMAVYEEGLGTIAMSRSGASSTLAQADSRTPKRAESAPVALTKPVSYVHDIKPMLEAKCSECHEGDTLKGGFDISTVASITRGGHKAGAGLIAGKPDASPIIQYVEGLKQPRMPKGATPLNDAQIAMLKSWITSGALDDSSAKVAAVATTAPTGPVAYKPSPDWDPQVQFSADEAVAVRRFVRMKDLPPPPEVPKVNGPVENVIDNFIVTKWMEEKTQPTTRPAVCDDATYVRRVYLDLIGMIPTAQEAKQFVEDKDKDKRAKLVDALLARTKDYAGNWVPFWEDALCSNGNHQGGVGTHGNYRQWLFDSFLANKPYDTMVQELLDPTMPNHPQRYVLNDTHMRTIQSSADTAQVFLGTAIKCASCHSHFLNDEWPQARAVAFAGFFSDKDLELVRCERKTGEFIQTHFMFKLPAAPTTAPSDPRMRLKEVAQLITDPTNPRFAKTMVNRLWKRYMGMGLFEPVDDFRLDTPPTHPELLAWLADDFIRHGFDVKHTIRLILTSRTYQLKYEPSLADHFDVAKPKAMRYFRSPTLRRLTAEELLDSISVAMNQSVPQSRAYQNDESTPLTRTLGKPAARNEVSTARPEDTAVVQALELLNGQEYHDRVYKGDLIQSMSVASSINDLIDTMYWSVYSRPPTQPEIAAATKFIASAPPPASTRPVDVTWVDDALPSGAKPTGNWKFAEAPDQPVFSGKTSHTEADPVTAAVQHTFMGTHFSVLPTDTIFTYVYLDPANLPKEIMLQFHANGDWHRVSWGDESITFKPNTVMGKLPPSGKWIRLEIPAARLGFTKPGFVNGISYDQFAGKVYWDKTGDSKGPPRYDPQVIGDMLWALVTGPEFQYVK